VTTHAYDAEQAGLGGDLTKIDLNNVNIRVFQRLPGMYPSVGKKIMRNIPFERVSDVYEIGLTDKEREIFQKYEDRFYVSERNSAYTYDRVNNGLYR